MKNEIKICLPIYRIVYSICFVVMLSFVRGISSISEIGITLDTNMAVLAIIFCADTYQMEYSGKRWEVFKLYSIQKRGKVLIERMGLQCLYLWLLSLLGYACFFWQRPQNFEGVSALLLFFMFIVAVIVSISFWGMAAMTFANIFRNSWTGIGISIVLWLAVFSKQGEALLGKYNIFAFSFREVRDTADMGWLLGKGIALISVMILTSMIPTILKKRG